MAPTGIDYLHGLRRLWWVPLASVIVGLGLGLWALSDVRPTAVTTGNALFTFRIADPGVDSAGAARGAEAGLAGSRLLGYMQLARSSPEVSALLDSAGIEEPPTTLSSTRGFKDEGADTLIDVIASGLVEIRVRNGDLSQAEANRLVQGLSREVVRQAVATDAQQVTPSLQPDALITEPQANKEQPASRVNGVAFPVLLLLTLGLGSVYLLVWRQGRIYARRDIEERLGARVLGDLSGRPADAPAIALAISKGRDGGTTALLVPSTTVPSQSAASVAAWVADGGRELGLTVRLGEASRARLSQDEMSHPHADPDESALYESQTPPLNLIDSPTGLNADALLAAASVDIVALIVEYGRTSYRDLSTAGQTLGEVTDAEIVAIGLSPSVTPKAGR